MPMPSMDLQLTQWEAEPLYLTPSHAFMPRFGGERAMYESPWSIPPAVQCQKPPTKAPKIIAILLILALVMTMYFCHLKKNQQRGSPTTIRRLAGSGSPDKNSANNKLGEEQCQRWDDALRPVGLDIIDRPLLSFQGSAAASNEQPPSEQGKETASTDVETGKLMQLSATERIAEWSMDPISELDSLIRFSSDAPTDSLSFGSRKFPYSDGDAALSSDRDSTEFPLSLSDEALRSYIQMYAQSGESPTNSGYTANLEEPCTTSNSRPHPDQIENYTLHWILGGLRASLDLPELSGDAVNTYFESQASELSTAGSGGSGIPSPMPSPQQHLDAAGATGTNCGENSANALESPDESDPRETSPQLDVHSESTSVSVPRTPMGGDSLQTSASGATEDTQTRDLLFPDSSILLTLLSSSSPEAARDRERSTNYDNHPFYQLPVVLPGVQVEPFNTQYAFETVKPTWGFSAKLRPIRVLLRKKELSQRETELLVRLAEQLVAYADKSLRGDIVVTNVSRASGRLARRFLAADALWSICKAVGPAMRMETWWRDLMKRMANLPTLQSQMNAIRNPFRCVFIRRILAALQLYRVGRRPDAKEVVELMQWIFCPPNTVTEFARAIWDPWRKENELFLSPQ